MRRIASIFNAALAIGVLALAFQGLTPAPAVSQSNTVISQGTLVNGHAIQAVAQRLVADACGSGGGLTGACIADLGITNSGIGFGLNSGPTTAAYNFFDLGWDASSNAIIKIGRIGVGTAPSLGFNINGAFYPFPGPGNGNVVGPNPSTNGALVCWNSAVGTVIKDCGVINFASGLTATTGTFSGAISATTGTFSGALSAPSLTLSSTPLSIANGGTGDTGTQWTAYVPTLGCNTGTLTSATAAGRYKTIGKTVFVDTRIGIATNGTCAGNITATLPVVVGLSVSTVVFAGANGDAGLGMQCIASGLGTGAACTKYDGTYPGVSGQNLFFSGVYESN